MAARFRVVEHQSIVQFNTGPRYLALYECDDEQAVESLRDGPNMLPEARDELEIFQRNWLPQTKRVTWGFYKMISKHYKL